MRFTNPSRKIRQLTQRPSGTSGSAATLSTIDKSWEGNLWRTTRMDPTKHALVLGFEDKRYRSRPGASCNVFGKLAARIVVDRKPVSYRETKQLTWGREQTKRDQKVDISRQCKSRIHIKLLDTVSTPEPLTSHGPPVAWMQCQWALDLFIYNSSWQYHTMPSAFQNDTDNVLLQQGAWAALQTPYPPAHSFPTQTLAFWTKLAKQPWQTSLRSSRSRNKTPSSPITCQSNRVALTSFSPWSISMSVTCTNWQIIERGQMGGTFQKSRQSSKWRSLQKVVHSNHHKHPRGHHDNPRACTLAELRLH